MLQLAAPSLSERVIPAWSPPEQVSGGVDRTGARPLWVLGDEGRLCRCVRSCLVRPWVSCLQVRHPRPLWRCGNVLR